MTAWDDSPRARLRRVIRHSLAKAYLLLVGLVLVLVVAGAVILLYALFAMVAGH